MNSGIDKTREEMETRLELLSKEIKRDTKRALLLDTPRRILRKLLRKLLEKNDD